MKPQPVAGEGRPALEDDEVEALVQERKRRAVARGDSVGGSGRQRGGALECEPEPLGLLLQHGHVESEGAEGDGRARERIPDEERASSGTREEHGPGAPALLHEHHELIGLARGQLQDEVLQPPLERSTAREEALERLAHGGAQVSCLGLVG